MHVYIWFCYNDELCRATRCGIDLVVAGARFGSAVRAFAHGAMGRRIDPSCGEPIELFLVPASVPRLV